MSAWNGVYEVGDDPHATCDGCGDEHPEGVLDDGLCPSCVDECDCADRVPAVLTEQWTCPKCDAAWYPEDEDPRP